MEDIEGEDRNSDNDDKDVEPHPEDNHREVHADSAEHGDTVQSEVSMADMQDLLDQQQIFIELLFQIAKMKPKDSQVPNPKDKFMVTHTKRFCGGAWELDPFLASLHSNC
jgi:hypothetical protein